MIMLGAQEVCRLLAYHNAGRHRIAGRYTRHYGSICNAEAIHAVDLEFAIDHRHGVAAHFCGATLMPEGDKPVAKEVLQLRPVESARCYLAPSERSQRGRVTNRASSSYSFDKVLQVLWIPEPFSRCYLQPLTIALTAVG